MIIHKILGYKKHIIKIRTLNKAKCQQFSKNHKLKINHSGHKQNVSQM